MSKTILIYISIKLGVIKKIHIGVEFSPEEIATYATLFKEFCDVFSLSCKQFPGIVPCIVIHEIKTYPKSKLVKQNI